MSPMPNLPNHENTKPSTSAPTMEPQRSSGLLNRPLDIVSGIVKHLADDKKTLANLALVSRDCGIVARPHLFADITLNCGNRSWSLLHKLLDEAEAHDAAAHDGELPPSTLCSIGTFVRRLTVTNRLDYRRTERHEINRYYDLLMRAISTAMPALETLVWDIDCPLCSRFLSAIARSNIRYLELRRVKLSDAYIEPLPTPSPIQLKHLCVKDRGLQVETNEALTTVGFRFLKTLLQSSAPTLEKLSLINTFAIYQTDTTFSFDQEAVSFPCLDSLRLDLVGRILSERAFSTFFSATVKHLAMDQFVFKAHEDLLASTITLPHLESLDIRVWSDGDATPMTGFIRRHSWLKRLSVKEFLPKLLDEHIVPIFHEGLLSKLTSLSIYWCPPWGRDEEMSFRRPFLQAVSNLSSLSHLCIGLDHSMLELVIDNDELRGYLKGLTKLRKLALCGETYKVDDQSHSDFYRDYGRRPMTEAERAMAAARPELAAPGSQEELIVSALRPQPTKMAEYMNPTYYRTEPRVRSLVRRNRMLAQAEEYAATLPALEWMYCGRWMIGIAEGKDGKVANPLGRQIFGELDRYDSLLEKERIAVEMSP